MYYYEIQAVNLIVLHLMISYIYGTELFVMIKRYGEILLLLFVESAAKQ